MLKSRPTRARVYRQLAWLSPAQNFTTLAAVLRTGVQISFFYLLRPQHFLYFLPLPQGQGALRPTRGLALAGLGVASTLSPPPE